MNDLTNISVRNYSFMFDFEKEFKYEEKLDWITQNRTLAIYCVVVYLFFIFGMKRYMQNKKPFNLRTALVLWNLGLTTFSTMAFLRTVPELTHMIWNYGFYYSVCSQTFVTLDSVSAYWGWMCALSKLVELGDTVFIVLRKTPLIFLHWYHHIATLLGVWFMYSELLCTGRWFMVVNMFVHSIMYFYYALRAMGFTPPRTVSMFITTVQIIQMIIGCTIHLYIYNLLDNNVPCAISSINLKISIAINLSYLILFGNFFYHAYISGKRTAKTGITPSPVLSSKSKVH